MPSLNKCIDALRSIGVTSKAGRTEEETVAAVCLAAKSHADYDESVGITPTIIGKMFSTRWAGLNKSIEGGITHFLSVDNAAAYAELWSRGENWYAVTGATKDKEDKGQGGVWQIPGVIKGMVAQDVVPLFLTALQKGTFGGRRKGCNC